MSFTSESVFLGDLPKTLVDAKGAGWHRPKPDEYGGVEIVLKGHRLVKDTSQALSRTAWRKKGRMVRDNESPHAVVSGRIGGGVKHISWDVYREDQTDLIDRGIELPRRGSQHE
jgi:hypothetical protein